MSCVWSALVIDLHVLVVPSLQYRIRAGPDFNHCFHGPAIQYKDCRDATAVQLCCTVSGARAIRLPVRQVCSANTCVVDIVLDRVGS